MKKTIKKGNTTVHVDLKIPKPKWRPAQGQRFYENFISGDNIHVEEVRWYEASPDLNYFRTKKEANAAMEQIRNILDVEGR